MYQLVEVPLLDVSYTLKRDGVLMPSVHHSPFELFGQKYTETRTDTTVLSSYMKKGIRKGDVLLLQLGLNRTHIANVEATVDNPNPLIEFPSKCPSCNERLQVIDETPTYIVRCANVYCPAKVMKDLKEFLKTYNVRGAGVTKLARMIATKGVRGTIDVFVDGLMDIIVERDTNTLLTALGLFRFGCIRKDAREKVDLMIGIGLREPVASNRLLLIEYLEANEVASVIRSVVRALKAIDQK